MTPAELLVGIAGHGLYPSTHPIAEHPVGLESWRPLMDSLSRGLLLGLALQAADSGAFPVTREQRDDLSESFALAQDRRSAADQCLDEVVAVLDGKGIESCVMHGAANAALDYEQQSLRLYDTLHLLVTPAQREEAVAALTERDILRCDAARRRPRRQTALPCRSRDGIRVVVYTSLAPRKFKGVVEAGDLFPGRVTFAPRKVTLERVGE